MKKIILPAKLTIGFDYRDGKVSIVRCDVRFRATVLGCPEFPMAGLRKPVELSKKQQTSIRDLCKDIVLTQIKGEDDVFESISEEEARLHPASDRNKDGEPTVLPAAPEG